jgi:tetratricopeptide (TPR) repeat protein
VEAAHVETQRCLSPENETQEVPFAEPAEPCPLPPPKPKKRSRRAPPPLPQTIRQRVFVACIVLGCVSILAVVLVMIWFASQTSPERPAPSRPAPSGTVFVPSQKPDPPKQPEPPAPQPRPQDEAKVHLQHGTDAAGKGQFDLAILEFTEAIAKDANLGPAYLGRGDAYYKLGKYPQAVADYRMATSKIGSDPNGDSGTFFARALIPCALAHLQEEQAGAAIADFLEAFQLDPSLRQVQGPNLAEAYYERGLAAERVNRPEQALNDFDQALAINSRHAQAILHAALVYEQEERYDRSIERYRQLLQVDAALAGQQGGHFKHTCFKRGQERLRKANFEGAIDDFTATLTLDKDYSHAHLALGHARYGRAEYDTALKEFDAAIQRNPECMDAYLHRGQVWRLKSSYAKAIADYKVVVGQEPKNALAHAYLGYTRVCNGEKEAIADCTRAIELARTNAEVYFMRGLAYDCLTDAQKAIRDYSRVIDLEKSTEQHWMARAYLNRSKCNRSLAEHEEVYAKSIEYRNRSEEDYARAIKLDPSLARK